MEQEILIITSKLKKYIKQAHGLSTSGHSFRPLATRFAGFVTELRIVPRTRDEKRYWTVTFKKINASRGLLLPFPLV